MLPLNFTGRIAFERIAFEHIETKVKTDIIATKVYCELLQDVMDRTYVPNSNGSVQYFKDMKNDQFSADILGESKISNRLIISMANHGFNTCGHGKERHAAISDEWQKLDTAYKTAYGADDYLETKFGWFQTYYNKSLKALYDQRDTDTKHQAHQASAIEGQMTDMESKLQNILQSHR